MIVDILIKSEEIKRITSSIKPNEINIIESNMVDLIDIFQTDSSTAFGHTISED